MCVWGGGACRCRLESARRAVPWIPLFRERDTPTPPPCAWQVGVVKAVAEKSKADMEEGMKSLG